MPPAFARKVGKQVIKSKDLDEFFGGRPGWWRFVSRDETGWGGHWSAELSNEITIQLKVDNTFSFFSHHKCPSCTKIDVHSYMRDNSKCTVESVAGGPIITLKVEASRIVGRTAYLFQDLVKEAADLVPDDNAADESNE